MHTSDYFITCKQCQGEVNSFKQTIDYEMTDKAAVQGSQTIVLSCGCTIDFPSWKIDLETGWCQISNYAGTLFIEFYDEELLDDEDEDFE